MNPEGWEELKIAKLLSQAPKNGYSPVSPGTETGWHVLSLAALTGHGLDLAQLKVAPRSALVQATLLKKGDILISRANTPDKVGRSALFQGAANSISYPDLMMRTRTNEAKADASFLVYLLQSKPVHARLKARAAGTSVSMVKLTKTAVENLNVVVPPLIEQQKIAKILHTWDQAIKATEQLIKYSEAQKRGLMQQILTGRRRLPGFKDEWKETTLDSVFEFKKGQGLSKGDLTSEGLKPCILYGELYTRYSEIINFVESRTNSNRGTLSKRGDILIPASTTTTGIDLANATALMRGNVQLSGDINILRPKRGGESSQFYAYLLTHVEKHKIAARAQGITIIHLYGSHLKPIKIKVPSPEEQHGIAQILISADRELCGLAFQLENLKQQKKALMQQLLTGKRRVKLDGGA